VPEYYPVAARDKVELENERTRHDLIPASEHITDMREIEKIFNAALDGIDGELAQDLAGMTDAAVIADRINLESTGIRERVADSIEAYAATVDG